MLSDDCWKRRANGKIYLPNDRYVKLENLIVGALGVAMFCIAIWALYILLH